MSLPHSLCLVYLVICILFTIPIVHLQSSTSSENSSDLPPLAAFFSEPLRYAEQLSPDGKSVAFLGPDECGTTQLWVVSVLTPELPRRVSQRNKGAVRNFFWFPSDSSVGSKPIPTFDIIISPYQKQQDTHTGTLLWQSDCPDQQARFFFTNLDTSKCPKEILHGETRHKRLHGIVTGAENQGFLIGLSAVPTSFPDLYFVPLQSDTCPTLIITNDYQIISWAWDESGRIVAGLRWTKNGGKELLKVDIYPPQVVYEVPPADDLIILKASTCGNSVLILTNHNHNLTYAAWVNLADGSDEIICIDPFDRVDIAGLLIKDDHILASNYSDKSFRWHSKCNSFSPILNNIKDFCEHDGFLIHGIDESRKTVLFRRLSSNNPGSTWVVTGAVDSPTFLWKERPDLLACAISESDAIEYTASDGTIIPAYITIPQNTSGPWPLVVFPHGGPRVRTHGTFDGRAHFLASRGYLVLQPNFRGSRGYGKVFMNAGNRQWGKGVMQTDLSDGVAHLVNLGLVDSERVAIFGGSYGGYASLAGLAFTPKNYAAGISLFGISDLLQFATHNPYQWEAFAGEIADHIGDSSIEEDRIFLQDLSPVNHVDSIQSPLLIYHGSKDTIIPTEHTTRVAKSLKTLGKPVTLLIAPDEGHGFSKPESEMAVYRAIEHFLHKHLGGMIGPPPDNVVKSILLKYKAKGRSVQNE